MELMETEDRGHSPVLKPQQKPGADPGLQRKKAIRLLVLCFAEFGGFILTFADFRAVYWL